MRRTTGYIAGTVIAVAVVALILISGVVAAPSALKAGTTSSSSQASSSSAASTSSTASSTTNSVSLVGDWLTYHGGNTRDGYDTSLANVTSPSVNWKSVVDGPVYAEPLSFNGSVYVATE